MRFGILLLALPLVACGGKQSPESEIGATDSAPLGETSTDASTDAVDDGAPSDTPTVTDAKPTPETCKKFVGAVCSDATKACCEKVSLPWGGDACTTGMDYYCNALVDQVTLGKATFDPSQLDACVKGWQTNIATCVVNWRTSAKNMQPCDLLFNGTRAPGEACNPTALKECHAPPGFGAYCDQTAKKCRAYGIVAKDQPCNFYGSTIRYCDDGLFCDLTATTPTCQPAKALGAACDGPDDFSCGWDNVCKENKCTKGAPGGSTCTVNADCASFQCTTGKCTDTTNPAVSSFICDGTAGM